MKVGESRLGLLLMIRRLWIPSSRAQLLQAQHRLLQYHGLTRTFQRRRVKLQDGSELTINAIESTKPTIAPRQQTTCVLAHGLGSGLAFFYPNLAYLANRFERVIAFDWLGFGASDRPEWDNTASAQDATRFFTESFSEFCNAMGLNDFPFTLVAHSMGGLLATEFALQKPECLSSLVLISPAGLPPTPDPSELIDDSDLPSGLRFLKAAWDLNFTPGSVLRASGPRGPQYTRAVLGRRFTGAHWSNETLIDLMADYLYHCTAQPGSGEYAMNALLLPEFQRSHGTEIYARRPLLPRMLRPASEGGLSCNLPVHIIFGDNDWLYSKATEQALLDAARNINYHHKNISLKIAPQAGHHVYMDNADALHSVIDDVFDVVHGGFMVEDRREHIFT